MSLGGAPLENGDRILIKNEADAWDYLTQLTKTETLANNTDHTYELVIQGWDAMCMRLQGDKFHSSVTPAIVESYKDFQIGIYRTYAMITTGSPDHRLVSRKDKRDLQLILKISKGSTNVTPDLKECIGNFLLKCGEKMQPKHTVTVILVLGLMYFGESAWREYLQHRVELRKEQTNSKKTRELLQHLQYASEQENKRLNIIASLAQENEAIRILYEDSEAAHYGLLKGLKNADEAHFNDTKVTALVANELAKVSREHPKEIRMDGIYRITRVNSGTKNGFLLSLINLNSHVTLTAQLDDDFPLSAEQKNILQAAEWQKEPINLQINARMAGRRVVSAVIVGVKKHESSANDGVESAAN